MGDVCGTGWLEAVSLNVQMTGGGEESCVRLMGEVRTDRSVCFTLGQERVIL